MTGRKSRYGQVVKTMGITGMIKSVTTVNARTEANNRQINKKPYYI